MIRCVIQELKQIDPVFKDFTDEMMTTNNIKYKMVYDIVYNQKRQSNKLSKISKSENDTASMIAKNSPTIIYQMTDGEVKETHATEYHD